MKETDILGHVPCSTLLQKDDIRDRIQGHVLDLSSQILSAYPYS